MDELQSGDPRQIGPYWLEGRLGSGGMGRVYLGRSPGGRHVAIKVIRADLAESPDFRARFAREASAARKVSGIFTAPVVDADLTGEVPWLATSYIPGPSLADAVAQRGPMPPPLVLRLAAGLAEGLAAIHTAGVVHRDLKPSNVLLAEDGPRLIDFGISRSVESSMLTRTGMVVGSPGFMSPEQAEGRPVGPPSDIFSLGAVLTFAATGEGPFGEGSTVALLFRVVSSEPNTQGMPYELRSVVERCLAKDPLQRPTAAALLAQLSMADVVADPAREGTTRKSALPGAVRQAPAPAAGPLGAAGPPGAAEALGAAGAFGAAGAAALAAGAGDAAAVYPATEQAPTPPPYQAGAPEYQPTLGPSEFQHLYDQRQTPAPAPQSYQPPPAPAPPYQPTPAPYQPTPAPYQPPPMQQPLSYQPGGPPGGARPPRRRSRRAWPIAVAAVVVLIAVGAVAFLAGRAKPHANNASVNAAQTSAPASQSAGSAPASSAPASSAPATSTSTSTGPPDAAAMTAIGADLARSATVRQGVSAAISGVSSCSESPASGEATVQQAINTRQDILQGLQALDVSDLPNGAQLLSAFRTAMQNSLTSDTDYHAWMADLVSAGASCGSNPGQDSNYAAAQTADSASTASKKAFVNIWNPIAPQYGQQTYTDTGF